MPEKVDNGRTIQLWLNYCQENLNVKSCHIYIRQFALQEGYLEIFGIKKFVLILSTIAHKTPNYILQNCRIPQNLFGKQFYKEINLIKVKYIWLVTYNLKLLHHMNKK